MTPELEAWFDRVAISVLGYRTTLVATYELAKSLISLGIPGDFAECGVYAGAEVGVMAKALLMAGVTNRRVHIFDSFQGIPQPGPDDLEFIAAGTRKGGACCPMAGVQKNMKDWGIPESLLVYHPGWFSDTLPNCGVESLALLRLDGDLYESTRDCMKYLYPKVSVGGWVIVDDYPLSGCRKALHEVIYPQPIYFAKVI